jgi:hypothetical protein
MYQQTTAARLWAAVVGWWEGKAVEVVLRGYSGLPPGISTTVLPGLCAETQCQEIEHDKSDQKQNELKHVVAFTETRAWPGQGN